MSYKINKFKKNRSYKNFPKVVKLHRTLKKERQESFRKDIGCLRNIRCLKPLLPSAQLLSITLNQFPPFLPLSRCFRRG
jgi:hypothetical protein